MLRNEKEANKNTTIQTCTQKYTCTYLYMCICNLIKMCIGTLWSGGYDSMLQIQETQFGPKSEASMVGQTIKSLPAFRSPRFNPWVSKMP